MTPLLLVTLALLAAPADEEGVEYPTSPFSERIFTALAAPRNSCMSGVRREFRRTGGELHCGFPDIKSKDFVRTWDAAFPDGVGVDGAKPLSGWVETLGGWFRRYYEVDGVPTLVAYGGRQPGLVIVYFASCPGGDPGLARAGQNGVSRPAQVREAWTDAVFPKAARSRRLDGMVLMKVMIEADGGLRDVCLLDAAPRGYGFEESALEWIRQFRYEPAVRDGTPVAVEQPAVKIFDYD